MTFKRFSLDYVNADTSATYTETELDSFTYVDQGDFEVGCSPMLSEGFYNCVALIGLSRKTGLLGHFQTIDTPAWGSYEKFDAAVKKLRDIDVHTVVLAGGGMFDNPNDIERATADRAFAERAVLDALPETNVVINWNESYNGRQDILVYPKIGKIVIHNATTTFVS